MDIEPKEQIRDSIIQMATDRGPEKSICPSEVARALKPEDWRPLMPEIREVAAELLNEQTIAVTQFGKTVDPLNSKGHIRISIRSKGTSS